MLPDYLPAIDRVTGAAHRLEKPVTQFDLADEVLRAVLARLFGHGVKHMQPGAIVLVVVQCRRQVDDMRVGFARVIAKLAHNILVVDVAQERMQAAGKDDAGKQGAVPAARVLGQAQFAMQYDGILLKPEHQG